MSASGFSVEQDSAVQAYKQIRRQYLAAEKKRKEEAKQRQRSEKLTALGEGENAPYSGRRLSLARVLRRVGRAEDTCQQRGLASQTMATHGVAELLDDDDSSAYGDCGNVTMDLKEACAIEVPRSS